MRVTNNQRNMNRMKYKPTILNASIGIFLIGILIYTTVTRKVFGGDGKGVADFPTIIKINSNFDLKGTWGLTNYFDTIVANKEIAKYRLQTPTWFAILIEIGTDSLENWGSIEQAKYPLKRSSDTLTVLSSYVTGYDWYLVKNGFELQLIPVPNKENTDSTIYIFRKRDDLNYFTKEGVFEENVTHYFNDQLFKGKYLNIDTKQEVVFADNGKFIGMKGFNSYEVRNYFGTLHMYHNLDVIYFSNGNGEFKQYNWVFSGKELLLTEFIHEKVTDEDGNSYIGEYFVLGKEKIRLKIIEHK